MSLNSDAPLQTCWPSPLCNYPSSPSDAPCFVSTWTKANEDEWQWTGCVLVFLNSINRWTVSVNNTHQWSVHMCRAFYLSTVSHGGDPCWSCVSCSYRACQFAQSEPKPSIHAVGNTSGVNTLLFKKISFNNTHTHTPVWPHVFFWADLFVFSVAVPVTRSCIIDVIIAPHNLKCMETNSFADPLNPTTPQLKTTSFTVMGWKSLAHLRFF